MKRIECFLAAAGRHSHRRDFLCVQQPEGTGEPDMGRRGHEARRHNVLVLGQLHHQGGSERIGPAELAAIPRHEQQSDGAR